MAHVEFDWVAGASFDAEHPPGSGEVVHYEPGDRIPASDWGQAAHHMEANGKIMRIAINVADPGDDVAGARESSGPSRGLSDPTRQFLAYEGQAPLAEEEPSLEPDDDEAGAEGEGEPEESATGYPLELGGGMYELSTGSTVRGKRRAEAAQADLDAGVVPDEG